MAARRRDLVPRHHLNPDEPDSDPSWLNEPGPFNFWRSHFVKTLTTPRDHGETHIWVVNTESQTSLQTATTGGAHWFLVAWFIEPETDA